MEFGLRDPPGSVCPPTTFTGDDVTGPTIYLILMTLCGEPSYFYLREYIPFPV